GEFIETHVLARTVPAGDRDPRLGNKLRIQLGAEVRGQIPELLPLEIVAVELQLLRSHRLALEIFLALRGTALPDERSIGEQRDALESLLGLADPLGAEGRQRRPFRCRRAACCPQAGQDREEPARLHCVRFRVTFNAKSNSSDTEILPSRRAASVRTSARPMSGPGPTPASRRSPPPIRSL